jgi:CHAT domain-containing protein
MLRLERLVTVCRVSGATACSVNTKRKSRSLAASGFVVVKETRDSHPFYWAGFVLVGNGR